MLDEEPVQISVTDTLDALVHPEGLLISQSKIIAIFATKLNDLHGDNSRLFYFIFFKYFFFTSPNVNL
jgi:hypothetical protein